jgi:hypothetical protein
MTVLPEGRAILRAGLRSRLAFARGAALAAACLCRAAIALPADGDEPWWDVTAPGHWRLAVSPFTQHFRHKPEYEYVWAVGLERQREDKWMYGVTYLDNSFGQPCGYVYAGQQYGNLFDVGELFFQWTAGLLYGYKGEYQHRVPLNYGGFAPIAIVSLGWRFDPNLSAQLNKAGITGPVMLQLSYEWR